MNASETPRLSPTRHHLPLAGLAVMLLVAVAVLAGRQPAVQANAAALQAANSVGVLDFDAMMERSSFVQGLQQRLQASAEAQATELRAEAQALEEEARQAQQTLQPGTQQYRQAQLDIALRRQALEVKRQFAQQTQSDAGKEANIELLDAVERAVQAVAEERGLAVVLRKNIRRLPTSEQEMAGVEIQQLDQLIRGQTTLYVSAGADVTSEVVQKLDEAAGVTE